MASADGMVSWWCFMHLLSLRIELLESVRYCLEEEKHGCNKSHLVRMFWSNEFHPWDAYRGLHPIFFSVPVCQTLKRCQVHTYQITARKQGISTHNLVPAALINSYGRSLAAWARKAAVACGSEAAHGEMLRKEAHSCKFIPLAKLY